ncbi:MAG TPA: hypothetical protein VF331_27000 [Polyangiales bacterium]
MQPRHESASTCLRRCPQCSLLVVERFHWGRLVAYTRARACSTPERLRHLGLSPLLPLALFTRHGVRQLRKHRNLREFARAAPLMVAMLVPWSPGEAWGYATREP